MDTPIIAIYIYIYIDIQIYLFFHWAAYFKARTAECVEWILCGWHWKFVCLF